MKLHPAGIIAAGLAIFAVAPRAYCQDQAAAGPDGKPQGIVTTILGTSDTSFDPNQPIRAGFTVSVSVSSKAGPEPDLTGVFPVDASGAILLKLVGRVEV